MPGTGAVAISVPDVAPGMPLTVGMGAVCLTHPGTVTLEGVGATEATGGLRVTAFAVGPNPFLSVVSGFGTARSSPRVLVSGRSADRDAVAGARGLDPDGTQVVHGRCDVGAEVGQLSLELTRSTDLTASTHSHRLPNAQNGRPAVHRTCAVSHQTPYDLRRRRGACLAGHGGPGAGRQTPYRDCRSPISGRPTVVVKSSNDGRPTACGVPSRRMASSTDCTAAVAASSVAMG